MPAPAVGYWTGVWDPAREALSKEVELLRQTLQPQARVVSIASGQRVSLRRGERAVTLGMRHWPLLRALAVMLERRAHVTHVFGEMHAWHLIRALGRRPIVFTVAIAGPPLPGPLLDKVRMFVAENDVLAEVLLAVGVPADRVMTIHPGVDLGLFRPEPFPTGRFTLLFASTPAAPAEFEARGIPLLVDVARRCPDIDVLLMWRAWGNQGALEAALARLAPPVNMISRWGDVPDMAAAYNSAHAVAFFVDGGKSSPNSVLEALACGRPAVVGETCGVRGVIAAAGAGSYVARDAEAIAAAVAAIRQRLPQAGRAARALAEDRFDHEVFVRAYDRIYRSITTSI